MQHCVYCSRGDGRPGQQGEGVLLPWMNHAVDVCPRDLCRRELLQHLHVRHRAIEVELVELRAKWVILRVALPRHGQAFEDAVRAGDLKDGVRGFHRERSQRFCFPCVSPSRAVILLFTPLIAKSGKCAKKAPICCTRLTQRLHWNCNRRTRNRLKEIYSEFQALFCHQASLRTNQRQLLSVVKT